MLKTDRVLQGPRQAEDADVPALNRVFSDSFTDRYRRDGLVGVRVPQLNPAIWQYAIRDAGEGAMVWFDEQNELVALNMAHYSGREGWMGPLAVRPDRQGLGVGKLIVDTAIEWLRGKGVRTLGLETMPRTVENIGFYSRLGFVPQHLTMTMTGTARRRSVHGTFKRLRQESPVEQQRLVASCHERIGRSDVHYDFTREVELTSQLDIGDAVIVEADGEVTGFALWHSAALAKARAADELRVLKLFADSLETFDKLVVACEACAVSLGIARVSVRCQTAYAAAFQSLVGRDYRVRWTDLRMTLHDLPEATLPPGEVLFSNWEI